MKTVERMTTVQLWVYCLRKIFDLPATIIIIHGEWKLGKTDFALFLYEELMRLGIIRKGATNIITKDSSILCIQNMPYLKQWMFKDKIPKLYIYDESIRGTPRRRAMSKLNVAWLQDIIPELSKGKAKLIVISQELEFTESIFYHPTFLRGIFEKVSLKTVVLKSRLIKQRKATFYDVPRTSIKFDPFRGASFSLEATIDFYASTDEQKIVYLYGKGKSFRQIGNSFSPPKHQETIIRLLRKVLTLTDEEKVAYWFSKGLSFRQVGEKFNPPKHPELISRLLRKNLMKRQKITSQVTHNSARDISQKAE